MDELTEAEEATLREMFEDFGYEPPATITLEATREMLADALADDSNAYSVEQLSGIADAISEGMPDEDDESEPLDADPDADDEDEDDQ
jgi:hypothetical protein